MRVASLFSTAFLALAGHSAAAPTAPAPRAYQDAVTDLQTKGRTQINAQLAKSTTCSASKLLVRKEWGDLTTDERKAYINAVLCIMKRPSKFSATAVPGAKSRYDDFVAVHIQQTLSIHSTGNFLSWHRYHLWSYEQALRTECGYNGTQPYWDWGRWAQDPEKSPIFDGSDTSMSGNGLKTTHNGNSYAPAGNGGGCVQAGPFKDMVVHLGPVAPATDPAPKANPQSNGLGDNPRCLRRDMSNYLTTRYTKTTDIVNCITKYNTIGTFQDFLQGGTGPHGAGHFTINGDPGADFYTSPGDPAFWLHHGMIDRTWTIWQSQDLPNRMQVIAGGTSMFGGGKAQTLEDNVDLGNLASKVYKIKELVSVVDGPFCYVYE